MIDLLIAILIALGCSVTSDQTEAEIKNLYPDEYQTASKILDEETYKTVDGGGIVIIEGVGD